MHIIVLVSIPIIRAKISDLRYLVNIFLANSIQPFVWGISCLNIRGFRDGPHEDPQPTQSRTSPVGLIGSPLSDARLPSGDALSPTPQGRCRREQRCQVRELRYPQYEPGQLEQLLLIRLRNVREMPIGLNC
jgi:hypothetical protein